MKRVKSTKLITRLAHRRFEPFLGSSNSPTSNPLQLPFENYQSAPPQTALLFCRADS